VEFNKWTERILQRYEVRLLRNSTTTSGCRAMTLACGSWWSRGGRVISIAKLRGRARGHGSELLLACDMRFAFREKAVLA
jgi:hypothetical protein